MNPITYRAFDIDELKKAFHYAKGLLEVAKFGVLITISLKKQKRSIQQNSYYRGVIVKMMADEMGHTPNEMHQILTQEFLTIAEIEENGKIYPIVKSTTELKTDEMEEYNENCRRYASKNLHIYIPLPNEIPEEII